MSSSVTLDDLKGMLEDVLSKFIDQNKWLSSLNETVTGLSETVTGLSTEVSSVKADQGRLHVIVNNVQNQILQSGDNNRPKANAPLFVGKTDKEVSASTPTMGAALMNAATHKLRFPKYDGSEDPLLWLHRCEQFFRAANTPEAEKVLLAAFYMQGAAQQWYYMQERNQAVPTWPRFTELTNQRFGPPPRAATPLASCATSA